MKTPKLLGHCCDAREVFLFFENADVWRREHGWPAGQWQYIEGPPYAQMRPEPAIDDANTPATKRRSGRRK